ncbi:MAG: NnrS family protein [Gammaproteobacteria bacterium]|nr:NnrS family protein [Gammaproteobacteria bacterium]
MPILALGFRPFYLGAALFAALAVPAWFAAYRGWFVLGGGLPGVAWHAHEMLFGFAPAVIAGFLLAAVRNWTGRPTPTGRGLASLFGLWLAGRVVMVVGPASVAIVVDVAFLPVLALVLGIPILRSRNTRNLFVPAILVLLAIANLAFHLAYRDSTLLVTPAVAIRVAADALTCLMAVIAGRVIPAFAANAIDGLHPRRWPVIEWLAIGSVVLIALADILSIWWLPPAWACAAILTFAAVTHLVRLLGWQPWRMRHNLLLGVLPISYCWIPIYLALRGWPPESQLTIAPLALHALVIGAMAGLMLSMMTRSALGHTGRALTAGRREAAIFLAIHAAAIARVAVPFVWPAAHTLSVGVASALWTVAFATFAIGYWPILTRPRIDGKAG